MGSSHHRPPPPLHLVQFFSILVTAGYASAQSSPAGSAGNGPYLANPNFNPSMAIVIVVLISAFFFLGFFSIYIRQCAGDRADRSARGPASAAANAGRSRRQRGLDPDLLASFPTLVYSDVKAHKIGKGSLECAVCLSEFDDDETLRLLPQCSHVFHPDCIDAWLSAHVTCPVCRAVLTDPIPSPLDPTPQQNQQASITTDEECRDQVAVQIQNPSADESLDDERKVEMENLERFVNMKRARSRARPASFPRSHSTGHSLVLPGENLDRFTLRLPENIRREIVSRAERFQRTKSCVVGFAGEGSSRLGFRGGEGSGRAGMRSVRLGRSDRWGSFLMRTLSTKWRRGGGGGEEGSTSARGGGGSVKFKSGDSIKGEGSIRRFNAVIAPFDCYGGATAASAAKNHGLDVKNDDSQSSIAVLNRV